MVYVTDIGGGSISILQNSKNANDNNSNSNSNNINVTRTFEKINGFIAPAGIAINISTNKAYVRVTMLLILYLLSILRLIA